MSAEKGIGISSAHPVYLRSPAGTIEEPFKRAGEKKTHVKPGLPAAPDVQTKRTTIRFFPLYGVASVARLSRNIRARTHAKTTTTVQKRDRPSAGILVAAVYGKSTCSRSERTAWDERRCGPVSTPAAFFTFFSPPPPVRGQVAVRLRGGAQPRKVTRAYVQERDTQKRKGEKRERRRRGA